ncbi:nuclear transport factor 2 family protein [Caproiciproducens galactitolivorans]|uniref:Nuclear transport factor 2 family protein n=1 Tax=Caproiciproducens galactitolivorans TaxID=642589 RepID=A0ABT4BS97_9FIRM|nr:nuclear transport factor 2 family protein [Caproiciproducens galactitolivorans]MCY1713779.1 nuclear transport factor 2 family protein [Caproiciproducens galactitolivorans]
MDYKLITQYWEDITKQDEQRLREYFCEDACIRWHNTNEQFNVEEFLRANCDYPGKWDGTVERMEQIGNLVITVVHVWTEGMSFHVTSFMKMNGNRIVAIDEYWGDDGCAPQWRMEKHIGKPIQ